VIETRKMIAEPVKRFEDMNPRERLGLLFDSAIRFAERGKRAAGVNDKAGSAMYIGKSQAIVQELQNVLRHQAAPELCGALSALYTYIIDVLTVANLQHDGTPEDIANVVNRVDEAIDLLKTVRTGFGPLAGDE